MTPERWQQVDKLLDQALEHEPDRRSAFLDKACQGDAALRQEVEALLSAHRKASDFIEAGPLGAAAGRTSVAAAQRLTGRQVGHFQILSRLGEGGMGIVYKARDQHLDCFVAIKVLPPELVADPEQKAIRPGSQSSLGLKSSQHHHHPRHRQRQRRNDGK